MPPEEKTGPLRWILEKPGGKNALLLADRDAPAPDRVKAAFLLGKRGGENAFWALARSAFDEDFWVRADAVRALARLEDFRGLPFLLERMNDPEGLVRFEARLALLHLLSRGDVSRQHNLLDQFRENSASGRGAFHITALPGDITLNVLDRPILFGKGIDMQMRVGDHVVALHEGDWDFRADDEHTVRFISRHEKSGVELDVALLCDRDDFLVTIQAIIPEEAIIHYPFCDLFFSPEVSGGALLPANGLAPGPTRRLVLGNEILMRRCRFPKGPAGVTLDVVESPIFRHITMGRRGKKGMAQLLPSSNEYRLPAGRYALLVARVRPHPTLEDFRAHRGLLLREIAGDGGALRVQAVGSMIRALFEGKNVLASFGLFLDFVVGDRHHTSFNIPLRFTRKNGGDLLAGRWEIPAFGLSADLEISIEEDRRILFRLTSLALEKSGDELRFGLLLSGKYARWRTDEPWATFKPPLGKSKNWNPSIEAPVQGRKEIGLRTALGFGPPPLRIALEAEDRPEATFAVKTTDEGFNARAIELRLPAGKDAAPAGLLITLETGK